MNIKLAVVLHCRGSIVTQPIHALSFHFYPFTPFTLSFMQNSATRFAFSPLLRQLLSLQLDLQTTCKPPANRLIPLSNVRVLHVRRPVYTRTHPPQFPHTHARPVIASRANPCRAEPRLCSFHVLCPLEEVR